MLNSFISILCATIFFLVSSGAWAESVAIHTIQGQGSSSPLAGQTLTVEGMVIGDFQAPDELKGFFLQEESPDGDQETSQGVFIYHNQAQVRVGDRVELTGKVTEYHGLTEITNVSGVSILESGVPMPAPAEIRLPLPSEDYLERFEGMRVVLAQRLTVSDIRQLTLYGAVVLSNGRLLQPTAVAEPGANALAVARTNALNRIILDDGAITSDPSPIPYPASGMTADNPLRTGYSVQGLTGVLDYSFGQYRIHPTELVVFDKDANPRNDVPDLKGRVRVVGFNLKNYFNGPEFPTERGAASAEAFARQHAKIIAALTSMNADVMGLMEVENDGYGPDSAIAQLTKGLNAASSEGVSFDYIRPENCRNAMHCISTIDVIANALVYRRETVAPEGPAAALITGAFAGTSRPPLAQSFREIATNEIFTMVVNHFRSRSTPCDDDPDVEDGQGYCNSARTRAAQELVAWLETMPFGVNDPDVLIIGDLNAYPLEDPLKVLVGAGYVDLLQIHSGPGAYSYVYGGAAGALDHALASPSLAAQIHNTAPWHINSDEPSILDYEITTRVTDRASVYDPGPFRSSDHDPVIVAIDPGSARRGAADGISVLKIAAGFDYDDAMPGLPILDVDGNGRIGLADAIALLRLASVK